MVVVIAEYHGGFVLTSELRAGSSVDITVSHDCAGTKKLFDGFGDCAEVNASPRLARNWDAICFVLVGSALHTWVKVSKRCEHF